MIGELDTDTGWLDQSEQRTPGYLIWASDSQGEGSFLTMSQVLLENDQEPSLIISFDGL